MPSKPQTPSPIRNSSRWHEGPNKARRLSNRSSSSGWKERFPLTESRTNTINGVKKKVTGDIRRHRPAKKATRAKSIHEITLMVNHWANELNACEYMAQKQPSLDQATLDRLEAILDRLEGQKSDLPKAMYGLLAQNHTGVIASLNGLAKSTALESQSRLKDKARQILQYWPEFNDPGVKAV
jgi:hypothetical protein